MKTSDKTTALRTVLILTLMVGLSASLLIPYHNYIEANNPKEEWITNLILEQVIPGATEFKPVINEKDEIIYYEAFDEEGKQRGYGLIFTGQGMWGEIKYAGGIDLEYKLTGVTVLEQGETPGLGARIEEQWFQEQFKGLKAEEVELKKFGGEVNAITGATTTSKAVVDAIKKEMNSIQSITGG